MPKSKHASSPRLTIHTYEELDKFSRAFAQGHLNLLILSGNPGLGKSRQLKAAIGPAACIIEGNATAFGIYLRLFEACDAPVLIDDIDSLYRDSSAIRLLKSLCQSEAVKTVSWCSDARTLAKRKIPPQFTTCSQVAIIANDWQRLDINVSALEDRGHVIHFEPSASEVHRRVAEWFWDQEIFDYIGQHLPLIAQPSFRHYLMAGELKSAGLDWKQLVLGRCLSGKLLAATRLKANNEFACEEDRARAFSAAGHGCRATYFNVIKQLPANVVPPTYRLTALPPEKYTPSDR